MWKRKEFIFTCISYKAALHRSRWPTAPKVKGWSPYGSQVKRSQQDLLCNGCIVHREPAYDLFGLLRHKLWNHAQKWKPRKIVRIVIFLPFQDILGCYWFIEYFLGNSNPSELYNMIYSEPGLLWAEQYWFSASAVIIWIIPTFDDFVCMFCSFVTVMWPASRASND